MTPSSVRTLLLLLLQNAMGDGGLYTIWGGILIFVELMTLLVMYRGGSWRSEFEADAVAKRAVAVAAEETHDDDASATKE